MAVALVEGRVGAQAIEIAASVYGIHPHALGALHHHIERAIVVRTPTVLNLNEVCGERLGFGSEHRQFEGGLKLATPSFGVRGGERFHFGESSLDAFLYLFFRPTATSQAAGRAFWERRHERKTDVDPPSTAQTMAAQRAASTEWRQIRGERFSELKDISQPTLVVNGNHDVMIPTHNSYTLSQHIPSAQLIIYPDSGHGVLFQFPNLFVAHGRMFLNGS